jgi:sugar-specific transcriptional regulator TrmB
MIESLKQLGWTEYEARAYMALLRTGAATGYRLARASGIPGAKIYETLARLVERGAAFAVDTPPGEPALYAAVPAEEVTSGIRARQVRMLDELSRDLAALAAPASGSSGPDWLHGRAAVLGRASLLLAGAHSTLAIALPPAWEPALRPGIAAARERGVRVDRALTPAGPAGESLFVLVADDLDLLVGSLGSSTEDSTAQALSTRAGYLVRLCTEFVRHYRLFAISAEAAAGLESGDNWLFWEEAKQRRLLRAMRPPQ